MALENIFEGITQAIRELEESLEKLEAEAKQISQIAFESVRRTELHPSSSITSVSPGLVPSGDDTVIAELID